MAGALACNLPACATRADRSGDPHEARKKSVESRALPREGGIAVNAVLTPQVVLWK